MGTHSIYSHKPEEDGYNPISDEVCICPYCREKQDVELSYDVWNQEIECEKCNGKFTYDIEVTVECTSTPIEGEGPTDDDGNPIAGPAFKDPNQLNLFAH